jgi:hypothetical protein
MHSVRSLDIIPKLVAELIPLFIRVIDPPADRLQSSLPSH